MAKIAQTQELKVFLDELYENLDYLDNAIIKLEEDPNDKETLEEVFRVAHTIKGSAGFLDLNNLVALGHSMENVFTEFYNDKIAITREAIDALLECKDAINEIAAALATNRDPAVIMVDDLVKKVDSFISAEEGSGEQVVKRATSSMGLGVKEVIAGTFLVRIWVSKEEVVPAIRSFLVKKKLSDIAEIIKQDPDEEYLESDEFASQTDRIVSFYVKSRLNKNEIHQMINVDLIDRIEILDESEQRRAVETSQKKEKQETATVIADASNTVRIPVDRLDILLNLIGEMVIANSGFSQIQDELRSDPMLDNIYRNVRDRTKELYRISSDIQELIMISRLVPIGQVFNRFKRFVRDYSRRSDKKVRLLIEGESTEIDKKIIDEISKPLTHLVRNSLDHGLETAAERVSKGKHEEGTLSLRAFQEGNYINIVVEDDGRGLNHQEILERAVQKGLISDDEAAFVSENEIKNFIFHSGFSTKTDVDEVSGRGIGMDVVKRSVEQLNGTLDIDSFVDSGTKITVKLPLTLAILNALIVQVGNEKMSIPMSSIVETQKVIGEQLITIEGNLMIKLRDTIVTLIKLSDIFNIESEPIRIGGKKEYSVVIIEHNETLMGILVDEFINRQEMVIKSLTEHYRHIDGISGASILGDGSIILIVDVHGVIQLFKNQTVDSSQADLLMGARVDQTFDLERNGDVIKLYTDPMTHGEEEIEPADDTTIVGEVEISKKETGGIALVNQEYTREDLLTLKTIIEEDSDKVMRWIKLGNQKVIEGLVSLTGNNDIRMGKVRAKRVKISKLRKLIDRIEKADRQVVDFALPIIPFNGRMHFLLSHGNAMKMVKLMWAAANLPEQEEYNYDPLFEVTNIIGSAYTNSLTEIADVAIEPGLPVLLEGIQPFKEDIEKTVEQNISHFIYIENLVYWGEKDLLAELLIMLPSINV